MIITGTQRSGTMSYATMLGVRHEHYFNPCNPKLKGNEDCTLHSNCIDYLPNYEFAPSEEEDDPHSEVSWLAAPHVQTLSKFESIIRLVRHPMKVINSLMGIAFWDDDVHKLYRDYISRYINLNWNLNSASNEKQQLHMSAQYYIQWHNLIPKDTPTLRIEDLINGPQLNKRSRASFSINDLATEDAESLQALCEPWNYSLKQKVLV